MNYISSLLNSSKNSPSPSDQVSQNPPVVTESTDKPQYHIVMLLDESGSMFEIASDIIGSVNQFLDTQKSLDANSQDLISLYKFSDGCRKIYEKKKIVEVEHINKQDYSPHGGTALFDAIGNAITSNNDQKNVMLVIITDGLENSSREHRSLEAIKKMLKNKEENHNWKMVYLSSDIKAFEQGAKFGFQSTCKNVATSTNNKMVSYQELSPQITTTCNVAASQFRTSGKMFGTE